MGIGYALITSKEIIELSKIPFYNVETNKIYFRLILHELFLILELIIIYLIK